MIYFDNAATTLQKPKEVAEAVYDAIMTMGNAARGTNGAALVSMRCIEETRELIAALFHFPHAERVAFTMNATESLNMAIQGLFYRGDHIISTELEHNSVLRPLYLMERQGVEVTLLSADQQGRVDYQQMEGAIRGNTRAIICTHASNLTGNLLDAGRIGDICKRHNLLFILDAAQTAGCIPIDMVEMNISVLCFTGHKSLLGPQGTGGICVGEGIVINPIKVGGSGIKSYDRVHPEIMPTALEAGTLNGHGIAGLNAALKYLMKQDIRALQHRECELMKCFYNGVSEIAEVKVYGDFSDWNRAPIVAINIDDYDSGRVSDELMTRFDIATRPGAHCAPLLHKCLGTVEQGAVRFSFSSFNTMEEVKAGINAVRILATE